MQLLDNVAECEITFALWDLRLWLICHHITITLLGEIYEITNPLSRVKLTPLHSYVINFGVYTNDEKTTALMERSFRASACILFFADY